MFLLNGRRKAFSALLILLWTVALESEATPVVRQWRFDVTADGVPVGTHEYVVREDEGTRTVQSDMHFRVRLLLIDAYRYDHHATESWQNDCLSGIDTRTEERGRTITVTGHLAASAFEVDGAAGHAELPSCVMTFAYWNPRITEQSHLLNAQTGAWTPVSVRDLGQQTIDAGGRSVQAMHYAIETEKNTIEVWYSLQGEWLGLQTTTKTGGHVLAYRLRPR